MKKVYTTLFLVLATVSASAQSPNAKYVRFDFNENPWELPVGIPNRDTAPNDGWGVNWAKLDDVTGDLPETHTFDWKVSEGEIIQLVLTPSNYKLKVRENAMVSGLIYGI